MQPIVELFVNSTGSTDTVGQVNLYGNEPLSLTYSITDVKDISKRNSTVSQNFTVPADKNNNELFNHIFNIGVDSSFDPRKKTPSFVLVDNIMIFQGNLQLTKIKVKNKNPVSYDLVLYGETADLVKTLGDAYITDLDFSDLNHKYTVESITNSWSSDTSHLGYYYPLIDYGYDLSLTNLNTGILTGQTYTGYTSGGGGLSPLIFKPALSNKYLWDKIFNDNGFSYTSDFINSEVFTETIIPYNVGNDNTLPKDYMDEYSFRAADMAGQSIPHPSFQNIITFTNTTTFPNFDNGNLFNQVGPGLLPYRYTADRPSAMQFGANIQVIGSAPIASPKYFNFYFFRSTYSGSIAFGGPTGTFGVSSFILYDDMVPGTIQNFAFESPILNDPNHPYLYPVQPGEQFGVAFYAYGGAGGAAFSIVGGANRTYFYNKPLPLAVISGDVIYNSYVPKKARQVDYVKTILTMFNLMVIPSKNNSKNLEIIPHSDYFAQGQIKNWTNLLDVSFPIEETLISEQQTKQIKFSYKEDRDYFNEFYKTDTQKVYGEYIKNIDNEWLDSKSVQNIDIIFSPTPMENVTGTNEIIVPKIGKLESSGAFGRTDFNIRFLRKNPTLKETLSGATITLLGMSAQTSYPYAGHLDDPYFSNIDYNFGQIDYAFYATPGFANLQQITPHNLIDTYWKEYLDDIADKNSKLIKCKIRLTPADIAQFSYNDNIYIDGLTDDSSQYFIVNKITYTPTSDEPSLVELIKINRQPSTSFSSTTLKAIKTGKTKRNVLINGDSRVNSKNSIVNGDGNFISDDSENSVISGNYNTVQNDSSNTFIQGNNNYVDTLSESNTIFGNNNYIYNPFISSGYTSGSTIIPLLSGVTILGVDNYTATTSDTVYMQNLQFTSSASTINGIIVSAITVGSGLWTSGTGVNSLMVYAGSNIATGQESNILGGSNNRSIGQNSSVVNGIANSASGNFGSIFNGLSNSADTGGAYSLIGNGIQNTITSVSTSSVILNGKQNVTSGQYSSILNGISNNAAGNNTIIGNGYGNVVNGFYTSILNGKGNVASNQYSSILNGVTNTLSNNHSIIGAGYQNISTSMYSSILNGIFNNVSGNGALIGTGYFNNASGTFSSILNGTNNKTDALESAIIGGRLNIITGGSQSVIIAGSGNTILGSFSAAIGGISNKVVGTNSVVIGGGQITGFSNNTVYVPNLNVQQEQQIFVSTGGTNATAGIVNLVAGTATVNTNKVTASSIIVPIVQGGTLTNIGFLYISGRVPGTSFTITSNNILDTSTVGWILLEQA